MAQNGRMAAFPEQIGRYRVLGELGRGAMGVVYRAEDPLLKRIVALKVVPGASETEVLERFRREAEISARLHHPNSVTVFDVGEEPGVGPFLAMECVEGHTLAHYLRKGPLTPEQGISVLAQVAQALEAAHGLGILHRDVKPENLMVDVAGTVKLMDFGIARTEDSRLTTTGLLCTPAYAAPELLQEAPPSPATDRWAFAVTAFQVLVGRLPFGGEGISATLYAIAHEAPKGLEALPFALKEAFVKALEKEPEARFPDLGTFLEALCAATDQPLPQRNAGAWIPLEVPSRPPWASPRALLGLGLGGILVLLLAWLGVSLWGRHRVDVGSSPSGAKVFLDDRLLGETPLVGVSVSASNRILRVEKPGYLTVERALRQEDRAITVQLLPEPLRFNLESDPPGAEVLVNGVLRGLTPLKDLQVPGEGQHRLVVRKPGFEPFAMGFNRDRLPPEKVNLKRAPREAKAPLWKRLFRRD